MMKLLKLICFSTFIIAAITTITLYVQLNTIIKTAVESYGPKITQTSVKLSSVSLQPFSGKGRIHGLLIGNPKGFKTESAFSLKDVRMTLEPKSLASNKIVIREILIDSPEITYEMTPKGNNLQTIQRNVESFVPASSLGGKTTKTTKSPEKKIEIDLFVLKGAKVHVLSYLLGGNDFAIILPDIRLENIGRGPEGATVKDAISMVFKSITQNVVKAVTADSSELLKGAAKSLGSSQKTLNQLKGLFGH